MSLKRFLSKIRCLQCVETPRCLQCVEQPVSPDGAPDEPKTTPEAHIVVAEDFLIRSRQSEAVVEEPPKEAVIEKPLRGADIKEPASPKRAQTPRDLITPAADLDHMRIPHHMGLEEKDPHAIFHWLQWAPEPKSMCYNELHKNFPGALPGEAVNNRIKSLLQSEEHGFTKENTLVGLSLCPDEINYEPGCLVDKLKQTWGHLFPLGGISGAPFVGVTGFGAFSHHVPDNGNIIIIYGPHVGITEEGLIGKTLREGQNTLSTACGAVVGAYNACFTALDKKGDISDEFNPVDMQMGWIKSQIGAHVDLISGQPNPMSALAYQAYEMVKAKLENIVNLDFGTGKLVLIGGIQINMPAPLQEHFLPLSFEILQKGKKTKNLMSDFAWDFSPDIVDFKREWTREFSRRQTSGSIDFERLLVNSNPFKEFENVAAANFDLLEKHFEDEGRGEQHAVFSWLSWSPAPGTPCFKALHKHFPGALPGAGVHCRLKMILTQEYGCTPANTLFGTSICPDEINNDAHGAVSLMSNYWGSFFPLGGLAGVPFAGQTGFKAFSAHVPIDGNIVVIYGPHVGISDTGEVGKYLRKGQGGLSTACGACIGSYNACVGDGPVDIEFNAADIQMEFIKSQIAPHAKRIGRQKCPMASLAYQAFESVKNIVDKVVNTEFGKGYLVLIGGIQINLQEPLCDHFLPLSCEVRQAGQPTRDISNLFKIDLSDTGSRFGDSPVVGA